MRFQFDGFELDGDRLLLRRGGEVQKVEPRVLELLVHLLENRDRLVTKEELNELLWSGRAVTDAALTRCLYQARKALGDSSGEQRYLCTVHGRGVRFASGVKVEETAPDEGEAVDDVSPGSPSSAPSSPAVGREPAARPDPPARGPRRGWWVAALTVTALGLALSAARWPAAVAPSATEPGGGVQAPSPAEPAPEPSAPALASSPRTEAAPRLAILPLGIEDPGERLASEELEMVGLSLVDLLHSRLSQVPGLALRPLVLSEQVAATAGSVVEIGRRMAVSHILAGRLAADESGELSVTLELFEPLPDRPVRVTPLGSFRLPSLAGDDFGEFLRVRDAIARRTASLVGSAFVLAEPETGTTHSAEAWRLYMLGEQRLQGDFCGGSSAARELLQQALEIDPRFGLAWQALGTSHYNRVWACGESADRYEDAMAALERALEVAPGLRVPRLTRVTLLLETGRVEEAYEALLKQLSKRPDEPLELNAESLVLRYAGFLDLSADSLDRVLEKDPLVFAVGGMGGSPNTYLYQGRVDRFEEVLPASEMPYFRWYRGLVKYLQGNENAAREVLEPAFRTAPGEIFGRLSHAFLAALSGDSAGARAIIDSVSHQRRELGGADGEITYKQAQLYALAGAPDEAFVELMRAVEQGFFCIACFVHDPILTPLRNDDRWQEVLTAAGRRHDAFARRFALPLQES